MNAPETNRARIDERATTKRSWLLHAGWIHLIYLVMPAFQPIFDPGAGVGDWLLVAGIVLAYIPLHGVALLRPERARWWSTVPTAVLGTLTTPLNAGASVLFVYAAAAAGASESRRVALRWFVGLTVVLGALALVSLVPMPWRLWAVIPPLVFIWVIGLVQVEDAERAKDTAELRLRNARIEHLATVSERERIARELHDVLGHSLTSVIMHAQLTQQLVGTAPERAQAAAERAERTAREALAEVRSAVTGWRQLSLDAELHAAREALSSSGVSLTVRQDDALRLLPSTERELALAAREVLTNVARHAAARTCTIDLGVDDAQLVLTIADDGVGGTAREGNGLTGIRERVAAIGGSMHRCGRSGTTITMTVPLEVAT